MLPKRLRTAFPDSVKKFGGCEQLTSFLEVPPNSGLFVLHCIDAELNSEILSLKRSPIRSPRRTPISVYFPFTDRYMPFAADIRRDHLTFDILNVFVDLLEHHKRMLDRNTMSTVSSLKTACSCPMKLLNLIPLLAWRKKKAIFRGRGVDDGEGWEG